MSCICVIGEYVVEVHGLPEVDRGQVLDFGFEELGELVLALVERQEQVDLPTFRYKVRRFFQSLYFVRHQHEAKPEEDRVKLLAV